MAEPGSPQLLNRVWRKACAFHDAIQYSRAAGQFPRCRVDADYQCSISLAPAMKATGRMELVTVKLTERLRHVA